MVYRAGQGRPAWKRVGQAHTASQDSQQVWGCPVGLRPSSRSKKLWTWLRRKKLHLFYNPPQKFSKSSIMNVNNQPQRHQNMWSCHQGKQNPLTSRFIIHCIKIFLYSSQFGIAVVIYLLLDLSIQMHYERSILLFYHKILIFLNYISKNVFLYNSVHFSS